MAKFRGQQVKVYVNMTGGLNYGWLQNEKKFNALKGSHGIALADGVAGVFYGANSPKPGIARKTEATGIVSSFYAPARRKSLASAGWQLSDNNRTQGIRTSGRAVTVAVPTPYGYDYAWNIASADAAKAIALGAERPTNPARLVWGSFPKLPRANIKEASGSFSTFIPPTQAAIEDAVRKGYSAEGLDGDWLL